MFNPFSLEGKTILVTGASSGLGQGIAIQCSKMGAKVIVNGRNEQRLAETLSKMEGEGHVVLSVDISTQEGVGKVVNEVPQLDGYVNSAGIPGVLPIRNISRDYLTDIININAVTPMSLISQLVKRKKLQKNASIVLIASINGCCIGYAGSAPYAASKGAIGGYIKSAALELAARGIRLNSISPGVVPTSMMDKDDKLYSSEQIEEQMLKDYPMKRLGVLDDISNGAVYLLSDASSWVTGINLVIDGGYTLA